MSLLEREEWIFSSFSNVFKNKKKKKKKGKPCCQAAVEKVQAWGGKCTVID